MRASTAVDKSARFDQVGRLRPAVPQGV